MPFVTSPAPQNVDDEAEAFTRAFRAGYVETVSKQELYLRVWPFRGVVNMEIVDKLSKVLTSLGASANMHASDCVLG